MAALITGFAAGNAYDAASCQPIQFHINQGGNGKHIVVAPGNYYSDCWSSTVPRAAFRDNEPIVNLNSRCNVRISGNGVERPVLHMDGSHGIKVKSSFNVTIRGLEIVGASMLIAGASCTLCCVRSVLASGALMRGKLAMAQHGTLLNVGTPIILLQPAKINQLRFQI